MTILGLSPSEVVAVVAITLIVVVVARLPEYQARRRTAKDHRRTMKRRSAGRQDTEPPETP